jgi:hypothetical protein
MELAFRLLRAHPTGNCVNACGLVDSRIDAELARLKEIMNIDLPKLNGLIREKSLPVNCLKK